MHSGCIFSSIKKCIRQFSKAFEFQIMIYEFIHSVMHVDLRHRAHKIKPRISITMHIIILFGTIYKYSIRPINQNKARDT